MNTPRKRRRSCRALLTRHYTRSRRLNSVQINGALFDLSSDRQAVNSETGEAASLAGVFLRHCVFVLCAKISEMASCAQPVGVTRSWLKSCISHVSAAASHTNTRNLFLWRRRGHDTPKCECIFYSHFSDWGTFCRALSYIPLLKHIKRLSI